MKILEKSPTKFNFKILPFQPQKKKTTTTTTTTTTKTTTASKTEKRLNDVKLQEVTNKTSSLDQLKYQRRMDCLFG